MESWCQNCHKRIVCTSVMCPSCYVPTVTSHTVAVYPSHDRTEIDALRTELARVKAESLRVVYLPDDHPYMGDYYMTPDGLGWNSSDRHGDSCVETPEGYHQLKECRKVKLERWEDE